MIVLVQIDQQHGTRWKGPSLLSPSYACIPVVKWTAGSWIEKLPDEREGLVYVVGLWRRC